jgi:peptide/nickel transport system ATP-binding protein
VTSSVFAETKHPYTRALIAAITVVTDEEERLKPTVTEEERMRFLVKTTD